MPFPRVLFSTGSYQISEKPFITEFILSTLKHVTVLTVFETVPKILFIFVLK